MNGMTVEQLDLILNCNLVMALATASRRPEWKTIETLLQKIDVVDRADQAARYKVAPELGSATRCTLLPDDFVKEVLRESECKRATT